MEMEKEKEGFEKKDRGYVRSDHIIYFHLFPEKKYYNIYTLNPPSHANNSSIKYLSSQDIFPVHHFIIPVPDTYFNASQHTFFIP